MTSKPKPHPRADRWRSHHWRLTTRDGLAVLRCADCQACKAIVQPGRESKP